MGQVSYRAVSFNVSVTGTDYFKVWLEYGTSTAYGVRCCESTQQPGEYNFSMALISLKAGTTYHLRAVTVDGLGCCEPRTDGPDATFTTKPAEAPGFSTIQTDWVKDCSCMNIQAGLSANGSDTAVHYEYGTTSELGSSTAPETFNADPWGSTTLIYGQIRDLKENTTYYWRSVLENEAGTTKTAISSFATGGTPPSQPPAPTPTPQPVPPPATTAPTPAPAAAPPTATPKAAAPSGPKLLARPTVTGVARVGGHLVGRRGRWSSGTRVTSLRWVGCRAGKCQVIGRQSRVTLRQSHVGMRIRFEVRVVKAGLNAASASKWSTRLRR